VVPFEDWSYASQIEWKTGSYLKIPKQEKKEKKKL
jgi:hypothetical protein